MKTKLILALLFLNLANLNAQDYEVFAFLKDTPVMKGCENTEGYKSRRGCSISAMKKYIEQHLKYPKSMLDSKTEGVVYVNFVVTKDGSIDHIKIAKSVNPAFDAEAIRIVNTFNERPLKWIPGSKDGQHVACKEVAAVCFTLPKEDK